MDRLAPEIAQKIFTSGYLSVVDIVNASTTCKQLRSNIYESDHIWKCVYQQNWPDILPFIQKKIQGGDEVDWLNEVKYVYEIKQKVLEMIEKMTKQYQSVANIGPSELSMWSDFIEAGQPEYYMVIWYLKLLITDIREIRSVSVVSLFTPGNKTLHYYCKKIIEYLRHYDLRRQFRQFFVEADESERTMESVAIFVAQWCQPQKEIRREDIVRRLDGLAQEARDELRLMNADHPLLEVPADVLSAWRARNLDAHQFNAAQCQQILDAINLVLYRKHNYQGNPTDFYDPKNSYLDCVLERQVGLPIALCVIYESVARRMGLNCEPMNIPSHFLLRFLRPGSFGGANVTCYIGAATEGKLIAKGTCPYSQGANQDPSATLPRATATEIILRMVANLENAIQESSPAIGDLAPLRRVYELSVLAAPRNLDSVLNLARLCMSVNMDTSYVVEIIRENIVERPEETRAASVLHMLNDYQMHREYEQRNEQSRARRRPAALRYAVGQAMRHKLYNYAGAITGWTERCEASGEWQKSMRIDRLQRRGEQPFYNVLAEDGSNRYVAEENIWLTNVPGERLLALEELGRHFSHFYGDCFVPNGAKEAEYPEDEDVRRCADYHTAAT